MWFPLFLFFDTCNKIKKIRFSHTSLTGYPTYRLFDKQGRMHHLNWLDDENLAEFKKKLDAMEK